jgi:hypothetical protein
MATRKPLVLVNGLIQQLQTGDSINVPQSGGDIVVQVNDEAGAIVIGTPVYNDVNDGVKKAKADAAGTKDVIGLVYDASVSNGASGNIQVNGVMTATTTQWDAVFGTTGGLTKGTRYFLSTATAGLAAATAPGTTGQYVVQLGLALSTTELLLAYPFMPILL